jgi:hypothetical protein
VVRRSRQQTVTVIVLCIAIGAGVAVWLIPVVFDDQSAARVVLVATLAGLFAIAFAVDVGHRLLTDAARRDARLTLTPNRIEAEGLVESGPIGHKARSSKAPLQLSRVDLRKAALANADLRRADLRFADFREADLRSADLGEADLRGTDLRRADLRGAILAKAIYNQRTAWPSDTFPLQRTGATDVDAEK